MKSETTGTPQTVYDPPRCLGNTQLTFWTDYPEPTSRSRDTSRSEPSDSLTKRKEIEEPMTSQSSSCERTEPSSVSCSTSGTQLSLSERMRLIELLSRLEKDSQAHQIGRHLLAGKGISGLEALHVYRCHRLAARIFELRKLGFPIRSQERTDSTRVRYVRYWLGHGGDAE